MAQKIDDSPVYEGDLCDVAALAAWDWETTARALAEANFRQDVFEELYAMQPKLADFLPMLARSEGMGIEFLECLCSMLLGYDCRPETCYPWPSGRIAGAWLDERGRGYFKLAGMRAPELAHRVAWRFARGRAGLRFADVVNTCGRADCFRPCHHELRSRIRGAKPKVENWKPIPGFPDYQGSDMGQVRRATEGRATWPGRILSPATVNGYPVVSLRCDGEKKSIKVHRAVLEAFEGPCPEGMQSRHRDGNRANNKLSNLAWGYPKANGDDRVRHGTTAKGSRNGNATLTPRQVRAIFKDRRELKLIAADHGITFGTVWKIRNGVTWSHITNRRRFIGHAPGPVTVITVQS